VGVRDHATQKTPNGYDYDRQTNSPPRITIRLAKTSKEADGEVIVLFFLGKMYHLATIHML